jgi:hypothetical protein
MGNKSTGNRSSWYGRVKGNLEFPAWGREKGQKEIMSVPEECKEWSMSKKKAGSVKMETRRLVG